MERIRKLHRVVGQVLRFIGLGDRFDDVREPHHLADEREFGGLGEKRYIAAIWGEALFGCALQHGGETGVGVLHIKHGVLTRLFLGEVEVELHLGSGRSKEEEEAGGIRTHLFDQFVERDDLAAAL